MDLNSEPHRVISAPTDVKTLITDGKLLYVGTSNGKVVTIPISVLHEKTDQEWCIISHGSLETKQEIPKKEILEENSKKTKSSKEAGQEEKKGRQSKEAQADRHRKRSKGSQGNKHEGKRLKEDRESRQQEERKGKLSPETIKPMQSSNLKEEAKIREMALQDMRDHSLSHSAVAIHAHMDERVRDLLFLKLPEMNLSKLKQAAEMMQYHSMPNLASPYGGRIPISPPVLSFRSLVISVGRGHVEYVEEKGGEEEKGEGNAGHRERHEAFQLLVWGHKNLTNS